MPNPNPRHRPVPDPVRLAVLLSLVVAVAPGAAQLGTAGSQYFQRGLGGLPGEGSYDEFGRKLAAGDFNADGYVDLAVGSPHESVGGTIQCGAMTLLYGTASGLTGFNSQYLTMADIPGQANVETLGFAWAVAAGDFDRDGYDDLAIAVPGDDVVTPDFVVHARAGSVVVLYGTGVGLLVGGAQVWSQGVNGVAGAPEEFDGFGSALASGDFDGDGYADLAIGVSGEAVGDVYGAGAVNLIYGSVVGLTTMPFATSNEIWTQGELGASEDEPSDHFGYPLAVGDFDHDGFDDLAIGATHEGWNATANVGAFFVAYGTTAGIDDAGAAMFLQDTPGVPDSSEEDDLFGAALAAGDFNGDGVDDLAVGAPGEDPEAGSDYDGIVHILSGSVGFGLHAVSLATLRQSEVGDPDSVGYGFGTSLAAGDWDGGRTTEIAIGAPSASVGGDFAAGEIFVVAGPGYEPPALAQTFSQEGPIPGSADELDYFGDSLVAGDFDGDGFDDLAVGVPEESLPMLPKIGAVNVLYSQGLFRDGFERYGTGRWSSSVQ